MKTALISVGTEILMGQIVNTNVVYLSKELNLLGFDVMYHHTVGDNPGRLEELIELVRKDCDLIITTGGLGPTQDDLTKEMAAKAFHDELVLHEPSMEALRDMFERRGNVMTENNIKQAYMPSRAVVFDNDRGTAPGFALEDDGKYIICIPGPPKEMEAMYQRRVKPFLEKMSEGVLFFRDIRMYGIGESAMETAVMDLIDNQSDPTIATYAKRAECFLRVASKKATKEEAKATVDSILPAIRERVGEYIYSEEGEELPQVAGKLLMEKNVTISAAESCTGGLFASTLIDIPGISKVFDRSLVTYSNEAKMEELGVKAETLEKYGAVSAETAREMAEGLHRVTGSDICISVTGVAGPDGGTPEKPVGLSYIGLWYDGRCEVKELRTTNRTREWNRLKNMMEMMDLVRRKLV